MREWTTLKDLCVDKGIQAGPFGSQLHQSDYSLDGTPVIMPVNLVDGGVSEEKIARVSDEHVERLARHKVRKGDLVYARRGDVGRASLIGLHEEGWLCGTGCLRATPDPNKVDSRYLFYLMSQPDVIGWFVNHAKGTTMLNLNTEILSRVPLLYEHSLEQQKRIAAILSAYDKLIENSRRQIALLEEAAQRLYKEWFVDLRFPGYEEMSINPETGLPREWRKGVIGEIADYISRGVTPKYNEESSWRVLGQTCVRGNLVLLEKSRRLDPIKSPDKVLRRGDLLINSTGVGSLGRTAQVWFDPDRLTADSHITIVRDSTGIYSNYIAQWAFGNERYIESLQTGSTGQTELSKDRVKSIPIIIPSVEKVEQFNRASTAITEAIIARQEGNALLIEARDRLLPKLMSGEIEVV